MLREPNAALQVGLLRAQAVLVDEVVGHIVTVDDFTGLRVEVLRADRHVHAQTLILGHQHELLAVLLSSRSLLGTTILVLESMERHERHVVVASG